MNRPNPLVNFLFTVEWGGQHMGFNEISALDLTFKSIAQRDSSSTDGAPSLEPGQRKPGRLTFRRGLVADDNDFFNWVARESMSEAERRDLLVTRFDERRQPALVWRVHNAWLVSYESPATTATGGAIILESLVVAHDGITVVSL